MFDRATITFGIGPHSFHIRPQVHWLVKSSVVTVPEFTLSVGFCRFFEKKKTVVMISFQFRTNGSAVKRGAGYGCLQQHQGWSPDGPAQRRD